MKNSLAIKMLLCLIFSTIFFSCKMEDEAKTNESISNNENSNSKIVQHTTFDFYPRQLLIKL